MSCIAVTAGYAAALWNQGQSPLQWGVPIAASLVAMALDVRFRRIPNWLTGPVFLGGLVYAWFAAGSSGLVDSALGCLILTAPYFVLFAISGHGGGDAKMMGAIGAWLGVYNGVAVLVAVAVCGIVFGLIKARQSGRLKESLHQVFVLAASLVVFAASVGRARREPQPEELQVMPYGAAIFCGVCLGRVAILFLAGA